MKEKDAVFHELGAWGKGLIAKHNPGAAGDDSTILSGKLWKIYSDGGESALKTAMEKVEADFKAVSDAKAKADALMATLMHPVAQIDVSAPKESTAAATATKGK